MKEKTKRSSVFTFQHSTKEDVMKYIKDSDASKSRKKWYSYNNINLVIVDHFGCFIAVVKVIR